MKRFEIMIATDRGEKKVSGCVSNEVALMLQACPKGIRIMYLKDEYEEQLHQRKETRRHISLDKSIENGHDFESQEATPIDFVLQEEENERVNKILERLSVRQKEVFVLHALDGWKLKEIGKKMGVSSQRVYQIYQDARKKIKKFMKKPLKKWLSNGL